MVRFVMVGLLRLVLIDRDANLPLCEDTADSGEDSEAT